MNFPLQPPSGISVLTLPDMRSAGEFWSLKLIEATGLPVRSVPLEESGHVDYFIGPQPHVTVQLVGSEGRERHAQLSEALRRNGHDLVRLDVGSMIEAGIPGATTIVSRSPPVQSGPMWRARWRLGGLEFLSAMVR